MNKLKVGRIKAKKSFEEQKLKTISINNITLIHQDKYNFIVKIHSIETYFGTLGEAIKKVCRILYDNIIDLELWLIDKNYFDIKPSYKCGLVDSEAIKQKLLSLNK